MTEQRPQPSLRVARMIASALSAGVLLFWIVAWVVTGGGRSGLQPDVLSPRLAFWLWAAVALCGFMAALVFRGRAVGAAPGSRSLGRSMEGDASGSQIQTNLIVAWALLEGPALLGGALFMLLASLQILSAAVVVYGMGVAMTFPRAEWFGEA